MLYRGLPVNPLNVKAPSWKLKCESKQDRLTRCSAYEDEREPSTRGSTSTCGRWRVIHRSNWTKRRLTPIGLRDRKTVLRSSEWDRIEGYLMANEDDLVNTRKNGSNVLDWGLFEFWSTCGGALEESFGRSVRVGVNFVHFDIFTEQPSAGVSM